MAQDRKTILDFARSEAGDLDIRFTIARKDTDGYCIRKSGKGYAVTANNPRSCLYAVYHIKDGGRAGTFATPWRVRGLYPCETLSRHTPEQLRRLIDRMGKWRFNTFVAYTYYGYEEHIDLIEAECAKRGIEVTYYVNTSFWFMKGLDAKTSFARDEQGKLWTRSLRCETRPCYSDPRIVARMERAMDRFFSKLLRPAQQSLLFAPADGYKVCSCPRCRRLSPMEQWTPVLGAVNRSIKKHAPGRSVWAQTYVYRYRPPADLDAYEGVDRIFFDTHQRDRWHAMGAEHAPLVFHREDDVDWAARTTPMNVYFADRIAEWRDRVGKPIVLFENLMVQGTFSCGQFNTTVLIEDLRVLEKLGVDGMLYEAFEPGMESFADEFTHLSQAMWNPTYKCQPTKLESWTIRHFAKPDPAMDPSSEIGAMANLIPAVLPSFPWKTAKDQLDPVHYRHLRRFAAFNRNVSAANAAKVIDHVMSHQQRFDWGFIGFWTLRRLLREKGIKALSPAERRFLSFEKLWDFMEDSPNPRQAVDRMIMKIRAKL